MLPAIIGAAATLWSAREGRKAQEQAAGEMRRLSEPMLRMQQWALPQLRALITQRYLGESPYLRSGHEAAIEDITRGRERALGEAAFHWRGSGRGRGEAFRIQREATRQLGEEGRRYAGAKEERTRQAYNALLQAAAEGRAGLEPAMAGIQMGAGARTGYYGDIAGAVGMGVGAYEARKAEERFWREYRKTKKE